MNLNDLRIFVVVARHGSITSAARELGIGKSTASGRLQALESTLGTRLLNRTTRSLQLTEAGNELFERGLAVVALAEEAQQVLSQSTRTAAGRLRVSAPFSFGLQFLTEVVAQMLRDHPRLEIDFALEDRDVDLVKEGVDVAVRIGELADSSLVARRVGKSRRVTVASPAYIAEHGRPHRPDDLEQHECLRYAHQRQTDRWAFDTGRSEKTIKVGGRFQSNNGDALVQAACLGLGIAWLPDFLVMPLVSEGKLVVLLDERCHGYAPIHLVFPSRAYRTFKEELFAEAVAARLARESGLA